jgi:CBS domain-containing protein
MVTVENLLSNKGRQVYSTSPDATVYEALTLMADKAVGALVVLENDSLVGIISERDYARKIILQGRRSAETRVAEIMTAEVATTTKEMTAQQCLAIMTEGYFRHLPVLEEGRVIGLVSIGDLVKAVIADQQAVIQELERYVTG